MKFFLFMALVVAVVLGAIAFQNPDIEITLTFIQWTITEPILIILAVPFGVGLLIGIALVVPGWIKKAKQARMHKEKSVSLKKNLPRHRTRLIS